MNILTLLPVCSSTQGFLFPEKLHFTTQIPFQSVKVWLVCTNLSNTILSTDNDTKSFKTEKKPQKPCYFMNSSFESTTGRLSLVRRIFFKKLSSPVSALGFILHQLQRNTDQVLNAEHACGTQKQVIKLWRASDLSMSLIDLNLLRQNISRERLKESGCLLWIMPDTRSCVLWAPSSVNINSNLCTMASQLSLGWAQWLEIADFRKHQGYFPTVTASIPS